MAKYGYTLYGLRKYGQLEGSQIYYSSGIEAMALDYMSIQLMWGTITPDPADPAPTHWKLVRTQSGATDNPERGTTVASGLIDMFPVQFVDTVPDSLAGNEIYYSIWLFNGIEWVFCGSDSAVAVQNVDSLTRLLRRLPAAWVNNKNNIGDATGGPESDNDLVVFLSGLLFSYDMQRVQASLLGDVADYRKIPTALLPLAVANVAMPWEPALGDNTARTLYRVGHIINAYKGSRRGVRNYVSALTQWGSSVRIGKNLMLDYNDSSFEESLGKWTCTGGTLTRELYTTTFTAPVTSQSYVLFPPRTEAYAHVVASPGAVMSLGNDKLSGIPVTEGTDYTISGYAYTETPLDMTWSVIWWGRDEILSTSSQSFTATTMSEWVQYRTNVSAPAGAFYAQLQITFNAAADARLDMFQFELQTRATHYQDARAVEVTVDADRTNFLLNPAFDNGTGGWYGKNAYVIQDSDPTVTPVFGSSVAKIDATGSAPAMISEWVPVTPGALYTLSGYATGSGTAVIRMEFTSPQSATEQISILSDTDGSYFPTNIEVIDSEPVELSATTFRRIHVTAQSPTLVEDNGPSWAKVSIYFPEGVSGSSYYADAFLLEQSGQLLSYFQGNGGPAPANPLVDQFIALNDCRWEWHDQTNLINDPLFESAADWTPNSGTTLSSVVPPISSYAGNTSLRVQRSSAGTAELSTTVWLENPIAEGGEDVSVSVRIHGFVGQVTITGGATSQTFMLPAENVENWSELWLTRITNAGETSFTVTISATMTSPGSFYLSAAQAELGRYPHRFVDPSDSAVTSRANLSHPSTKVWDVFQTQTGAGRSYYWSRYYDKYQRLEKSLDRVMPLGSSWEIISGSAKSDFMNDMSVSLVSSPSFEGSLKGWSGQNATLKREVSRGSHFSEYGANGAAWCRMTSVTAGEFGVYSEAVDVTQYAGYYFAAAVKPEKPGTAKISVVWYDINGLPLWTTETTSRVVRDDRWAYIALTDKNIHNIGTEAAPDFVFGSSAAVYVSFTPDSPAIGDVCRVDRVIFRE